jgi:NAD(P)-dependent dehydrogenase (short-subunit alcohol dehydrogenase family)
MNNLSNKVLAVTGGNGLIGREILKRIKISGAIAINLDLHENDDEANNHYFCDITDENSVRKVLELILSKFGRLDGWVNNAYPRTKDWGLKFESIPISSWKENIDLQLNSIFVCSQMVLEIMQKQHFGNIVNISSIYGVVGPDFSVYDGTNMTMPAAYSAIKGGLINFTRYLASYYGKYGIRVNCVSPGGIFDNQNEIFVKQYESKVPMKRLGLPIDIAPSVVFLLSDDASYITGHNLIVDGGWTAI